MKINIVEKIPNILPLKEIDRLFLEENGILYWKNKKGEKGRKAGSMVKGYLRLEHNDKTYAVHNILWMIYNQSEIPVDHLVDHKDGNPLNNSVENLRLASISQNNYNTRMYKNNKSGFKGVSFDKETNKWRAQIRVDGKIIRLGRFSLLEDAASAVAEYREKFHGEFTNHG